MISIIFTLYYIDTWAANQNIKLFIDNGMKIERIKPTSAYDCDLCRSGATVEIITTWDYFHTHSASSIEIMI